MGVKWSNEELQTVKSVRENGLPVKTQMHRFPGRTLNGVEHQMQKLVKEMGQKKKVTVSWVWNAARALLATKPGLTAHEISRHTGCSYRQSVDVMWENSRADEKRVYVSGWEKHGVNRVPQWTLGNEPDAPKLPLQTHEETLRKARLRYQKRHIEQGKFNPFALVMGIVTIPKGETGRVYKQSMSITDDEEIAA